MLERKEPSVTIFRGDDTGGQLGKTIIINFHCGDTVNMEGVVVTFILGGFYEKEFHNVHDGDRLEIFMTHEQTAMLPLGVSFGKLYGTDASGKIRTFSNRIPIRVTNHVCEAYGSAEESGIDVTISNAITWDSIFGKPETFPPSEHRHQKSDIDNLENDLQTLSDGVESAIEAAEAAKTEAEKGVRTVNGNGPTDGNVKIVLDDLADKDGNIETTKTIMVSRDGGESHAAVALYPDLISEIDAHNNDVRAHTKLMATVANNYATKTEVGGKYDKSGGAITGDVSISGSLSLTGSTSKITANQKDFSFPTESGKLARAEDYYTMAEVDDKITTFVAHYLTGKDSNGRFVPFATRAALDYAKQHHTKEDPQFFYAGEPFTPTKNDYCVVLADETVGGKTARYSFVGEWPTGSWQYQYTINDTAFSEAQWAAINSGVTSTWMESTLSALQSEVERAQAAEAQLTTKAENAQSAANAAQSAANVAQSSANAAQSAASVANEKADAVYAELANKLDKTAFADHTENTNNPHNVTAAQVGAVSISRSPDSDKTFDWSPSGVDSNIRLFGTFYKTGIGLGLWSGGGSLFNYHDDTSDIYQFPTGKSGTFALTSDIADAVKNKADRASLAPEYSTSAAYPVGSIVYHDGNIYQCTTAIAEGGEAWNAEHWQLMKLDDFFTSSNSLLTGTIDARLPYPIYAVPSTGILKDRALNTTSLASVTVPDNFTDLLIRASVASSLSVTMPGAIATKYGDAFPGVAGEYLITITKTGVAEAYVRTIKLEVANA